MLGIFKSWLLESCAWGIVHSIWRGECGAGAVVYTLLLWSGAEAFKHYLHSNAGRGQHLRCSFSSVPLW